MSLRSFHVLLVEDNAAHAKLATVAIERAPIATTVDRVSDGEEALAYLYRQAPFAEHVDVNLVLLDLKAPKVDGIEVLKRLKADPAMRTIPVVVLSSSMSRVEAEEAYHTHANSFLTKPVEYDEFQQMMDDLLVYWGRWNQPA